MAAYRPAGGFPHMGNWPYVDLFVYFLFFICCWRLAAGQIPKCSVFPFHPEHNGWMAVKILQVFQRRSGKLAHGNLNIWQTARNVSYFPCKLGTCLWIDLVTHCLILLQRVWKGQMRTLKMVYNQVENLHEPYKSWALARSILNPYPCINGACIPI